MHTGLEDRAKRLRPARGLLRRARPRRRRPHRHRRLRAQPRAAGSTRSAPADTAAPGAPPPRGHRAPCTREGGTDRAADPARRAATATTRSPSRRRRSKSPITPFTPARPHRARRRPDTIAAFARCAAARARGRLRRRRDHGLRGLPHQPVPRRRAPTTAPTSGAARAENRMRLPVEIVRRVARGGRRRLPRSSTASRCSTSSRGRPDLGRGRRAGPRGRGGRRDDHQHRHRLARGARPDDHHARCRAAPARACTARLKPEVVDPGRARPTGSTRPSSPSRSSPPARPTWSRWRGRCSPTRTSSPRPRPSRADEINTCIACNQACLDHVFANKTRLLPGQPARLPRDRRWCSTPTPRAASTVAVVGAGPAGLAGRGRPRPSAASTVDALREVGRELGGQFRLAMARPRQGGLRRDAALLHAGGSRCSASTSGSAPRPRPPTSAAYDEVVVATGVEPRVPRRPGHRPPQGGVVRRRAQRRGRRRAAGRRDRRRRHRRRRQRLPHPRPEPRTSTTGWRTGASATRRVHRGGLTEPQAAHAAARGYAAAAQDHADRHGPRQDVRLGAPRGPQAVGRAPGQRRRPTTASTTRACTSPSTASRPWCSTSTTSWSAPGQESVRDLYDELAAAGHGAT